MSKIIDADSSANYQANIICLNSPTLKSYDRLTVKIILTLSPIAYISETVFQTNTMNSFSSSMKTACDKANTQIKTTTQSTWQSK